MNKPSLPRKSKKRSKEKNEEVVYSSDPTTRYIQQYAAIAQEEMRRYKIPASITLAQGLLESQLDKGTCSKIKQSFWNQMQARLEGKEGIS